MSLSEELGFPRALANEDHEALLNILVTGEFLKKESSRLFEPLGITGAQFNVLILLLAQTEDGTMSQSDLGRLLTVNRSNVTGLVDRLEKLGLVARVSDNGDRRVNRVALTEEGRDNSSSGAGPVSGPHPHHHESAQPRGVARASRRCSRKYAVRLVNT